MKPLLRRIQPGYVLIALIIFNIIVGFFIGNQYGQTWDEPSFYLYGERSFDAYMRGLAGQPLIPEKHIFFLDLRYYGAFYTAMGWKTVEILVPILKKWGYMDVWHFVNFSFFQATLISLYFFAKRYLRPWTALLVVLLFFTQPHIFGHAFINPKDMPFLTFFLTSVTIGLYMADAIRQDGANDDPPDSFSQFHLSLAALFGLFVLTFVCKDVVYSVVERFILAMYNAPADSFLNALFSFFAGSSSRLPVDNYIHKAVSAHLERSFIYLLFLVLLGRMVYLFYLGRMEFRSKVNYRLLLLTLLAGVALGLATAVRLLAPFAGLLVAGYALGTRGRKSLPVLIYYFSIAAFVSYLVWPFLWSSPSYHFLEALQVMKDFPFNAEIRFMGDNISPSSLPWYYIPYLVTIQITEPIVVLAWIGAWALLSKMNRRNLFGLSVPFVWLILPVALQIVLKSNAYDNFRQFLFILPPMFIFAGVAFETYILRIKHQLTSIFFTILCFAPGLIGLVLLHPVQYIYYNGFVGGVSGAAGDFEMDYWLTSYREAASYINEHASPRANILAWGSGYNGAREDLTVYSFASEDELLGSNETFEYAVISTRFFSHLDVFKDAPVVYEVRKDGTLLAVVKKLPK